MVLLIQRKFKPYFNANVKIIHDTNRSTGYWYAKVHVVNYKNPEEKYDFEINLNGRGISKAKKRVYKEFICRVPNAERFTLKSIEVVV